MNDINRFAQALKDYQNGKREAPEFVLRASATADRLLKGAMDAFVADMEELIFHPLLQRIQKGPKGTSLVGRTRMVVTSGLETGLAAEMASFVETTRPKPFGKELLDLAFPTTTKDGVTTTEGTVGSPAPEQAKDWTGGRVLAGLPSGQALLLAALLSAEVEPTYSTVAPGITINARPTVFPDGGVARLMVDARFSVTTKALGGENRPDVWAQTPPSGIQSHRVTTDVHVSAFDLLGISSFSMQSTSPQAPHYLPILGRLPIIGPAFQYPRPPKVTHYESVILVNTVILPRALSLGRFYGETSLSWSPEKVCVENAAE